MNIEKKENLMIIANDDSFKTVRLDCPVCETLFRDQIDIQYYKRHECCQECAMVWAEPRRKEWDAGWRPNAEEKMREQTRRKTVPSLRL